MDKCYRCDEVISMCPCDESTYTADDEISRLHAENEALKRTVTIFRLELRCIANAVDDPRDNVTMTTAECIEALKKDAERYRWLRNNSNKQSWWGVATLGRWLDPNGYDRRVDAAMAAKEE